MKKTVCELFAGVGGFRCGLNHIESIRDTMRPESWQTVWFNQWEPEDIGGVQWAHCCYVDHFGGCMDLQGEDTTNLDIGKVDKTQIPDHNLLVGGFPCQDYSVASTLATSRGIEGNKGALWWSIRETLECKKPSFVLLENVDRLLKSPSSQRGRDFAIILTCMRDLGYRVEWRVINAADYGFQQRRRRTFIFAWHQDTAYDAKIRELCSGEEMAKVLGTEGFFATAFPVEPVRAALLERVSLPETIGEVSQSFSFGFENAGIMMDGTVYTLATKPDYNGPVRTLGDIQDEGEVEERYFVPENKLYYTDPDVHVSDEREGRLPDEQRKTWQYIKGGKKVARKARNGHEYIFTEGQIPMFDEPDKPARTMLTSEGNFARTTHLVRDKKTGRARLLTPEEAEKIQGFPSGWTRDCQTGNGREKLPVRKRFFLMGNALVVNVIGQMEPVLSKILEEEPDPVR